MSSISNMLTVLFYGHKMKTIFIHWLSISGRLELDDYISGLLGVTLGSYEVTRLIEMKQIGIIGIVVDT